MSGTTDLEIYLKGQLHNVGATPANTQTAATQLARKRRVVVRLAADAAASTTGKYNVFYAPVAGTITKVTYVTEGAITSSDTVYATLALSWNDGAGGSATVAATQTTKTSGSGGSGNLTADYAYDIPVSATVANRSFPANSRIYLDVAKASTGTQLAAALLSVEYTED